jgi:hypothetical protein
MNLFHAPGVLYNDNVIPTVITVTLGTMPALTGTNTYMRMAFGNGVFCAVGKTAAWIATSTDGLTWTQNNIASAAWSDIVFGNGMFIATSITNTTFYKSTDGVTWTTGTFPTVVRTLSWTGTQFVALTGTAAVYTSPDGLTWTTRTGSAALVWAYSANNGGNTIIATSGGSAAIGRSTDGGVTWGTAVVGAASWGPVGYGNGMFLLQASNGWSARSADGITWATTARLVASFRPTYGPTEWVVTPSFTVAGTTFSYSTDGAVTWLTSATLPSLKWADVVYGNGVYVFISTLGTSATVTIL